MTGSTSRLSTSSRLNTPLGVRARLNSLTNNAPKPKKAISSSTLTLQAPKRSLTHNYPSSIRSQSPGEESDSGSETDSSDEYALKEEEAERAAEEQEILNRKLEELQKMINNEAIGLVSNPRRRRPKSLLSPRSPGGSSRHGESLLSSRSQSRSHSQSVSSAVSSSAGSPHGSIPDIPSPSGESGRSSHSNSYPHSPVGRQWSHHNSNGRTTSPPIVNRRSVVGYAQRNHPQSDEYNTSSYGSEASSFSDLSDASLSASALESALMSNIRGAGSRFSQFAHSRVGSRLPR
ncbi:hypothetical protein CC1G_01446 [Coprinopsis cinerea okayama7|uniref:Uncharacterized protein n=1 Tax=Coprinopsis cinerea (strain Okayama-7 / 130 / ATCC MYA-4618 / FGSC 9003) TaxID=240176 RepID=A8NYV5_COPC7|nr:hypothetical protein CC1G_01446 [Coprinopsis cinerea okayama7\|eukprot:XP_001837534.2 hypothetical protein CC1G_01446 [Coprinopsis cinerea okayama7\